MIKWIEIATGLIRIDQIRGIKPVSHKHVRLDYIDGTKEIIDCDSEKQKDEELERIKKLLLEK